MQGKILEVNESMLKMYGYMPHEIVDADFSKLISEKENYTTKQAQKYIQYVISGIALQFDWLSKKKTGEFFWVNIATKKITLAGENAILAIARDINEQKEDAIQLDLYRKHLKELVNQRTKELKEANEELLGTNDLLAQQKEELEAALNELQITQEQLIQSEKMASLGILAAGVAHEINNPLNFIQGGLYGLENIFEDQLKDYKKQVAPLLNAINMGIRRAADIVSSLNDYSRKDNFNTEKCDMHQIIEDSLFMIYNKMKNKIEIEKEYSDIPYLLYGNKGQLHQVVINVLLNAIYAIKSKGIIHIKTELSEDKFKLSIKDNGTGISSENMAKVFDPFFTTREVGQGTGLGMSISLKIIEEHKGRIEYKSKLNEGTEVIITLPVNNV
jgi:PAS domain S-box-containing protein